MNIQNGNLVHHVLSENDFVLPPLPNHLFTRDTSCWIGEGVSINPMHFPARQFESLNLAAVYHYHPHFNQKPLTVWYEGIDEGKHLPSLEGGDVLVINERCVLVGISQRTSPQAIENIAKAISLCEERYDTKIAPCCL